MDDILKLDATVLAGRIADGTLTAEALMIATLDHVDAVNPALNAIVSRVDRETLLAQARAADAGPRKGPLHGLPIAVKDLADVAGIPTSMGCAALAGMVPRTSDVMVQRMIDAGAIVIGKTNTPEFGLGSHTYNPVFGATRNAIDSSRSAGGSSGGAALALAARMTSIADGSDMMGSLRNPAGWNEIYGLRPTWGAVPSEPKGDTFLHQLSTGGPMARSPADLALLLDVQAGRDPRQPHSLNHTPVAGRLDADVSGRKIAWLGDWSGAYPMEAGVMDHAAAAVARLGAMGCVVEAVSAPFKAADIWEAWITLRSWSVSVGLGALYDNAGMRAKLKPEAIWEIERGRALTLAQVQAASVIRSRWFEKAASLFETYDAFVLPTAQCYPFPVEWDWPREIAGVKMDTYHRWMEVVVPVSLIGLPCLAVPAGLGANGLPMGLQIAGPRGADFALLQLGQAWHQQLT